MPPQYDHGMARRFAQIKWRSSAEHSESTIRNFPTILRQARMKIEDGAKGFTPEAANLLYQHLLAENEPIMEIPMRIGAINAALFERILQRAALRGHELVDAGDVKEFLWSQRNLAQERAIIAGTLFDVPRSGLEHTDMMIGQGNMLVVIEDEYGAVRRNHAVVTGRLGQMKSIDMDSKLTDETYIKGVLTVDTWLQRHFGPLNLEIHMRMSADGLAGNSATAVHTYAAMSALGKIPLRQDVYVTGNINDPQGHIGVIGGVYEKARGALLFHNSYRQRERLDERPLTILVPEGNVRELLRKTLFDDEMRDAIESGRMRIDTHENVWEGFEKLCGLDRKQYEPAIRSRIKELETAAIEMSYALRHPPGSDAADLDRRKPN
jgi:predicted ATP-dependent protease